MSAAATALEAPAAAGTAEEWRPSARGWAARVAVYILIFGGLLFVTASVKQFWADRISLAAIYAIIGLSLNVVLGYVGQVSLGHHGFVGIAAFVSAYFATEKAGCTVEAGCNLGDFGIAVGLAALTGIVAAGLLGLVALRIKGLYLALITLAYGLMAENSIFEIDELTGSGGGMPAPRPEGFTTDRAFAYLTFIFLALVLFIDWRLIRSKVGRAILSLKHSEPVAASYGINVTAYKVLAFMVSGLFAGIAGALFAFRSTTVVSNDFNFNIALLWVLMVVIGGLGNRTGVVIGSAFFALFPFFMELNRSVEDFIINDLERTPGMITIVVGALLAILTIIRFPGGIAEQLSPITRWLGGQRFSMHPEGHGPHKEHAGGGLLKRLGLSKDGAEKKTSEPSTATDTRAADEKPPEEVVGAAKEAD
ncbi:MAG: branched-chain amino acid ABC transporter permease [Actinomycetota bacterium]